ncbi:sodium- and chloride-dependent GABA transporter 1-like [Octopus sinensis]|uniref:Sodium- and chloride-dependent GABA transporter 1-like n=1 Tax=Octopus sinensis TaxID=2607531 RepID=A0A6P7UAB3_9MOLL|nr:sodium- and chloride-dependent GABA transporter 1-like [Octopus sinensis]
MFPNVMGAEPLFDFLSVFTYSVLQLSYLAQHKMLKDTELQPDQKFNPRHYDYVEYPNYVPSSDINISLFLVAFYSLAVLICVPVCYVQLKLGSLFRSGTVGIIGSIMPLFKGAGIALLIMTYIRCLMFSVEMSYGLFYTFASLQQPFPWSLSKYNKTLWPSIIGIYDSGADRYLNLDVLERTEHIGESGTLVWHLSLVLLATWIIIYFCVFRGAAWIGKVFMVLCPVTMGILGIILIYGHAVVPTAEKTFSYMFLGYFDISKTEDEVKNEVGQAIKNHLGDPKTWMDALIMHIYSMGLWSGVVPMLGSHLPNKKVLLNTAWMLLLLTYGLLPHWLLVAIVPYINPQDIGGVLSSTPGMKQGLPVLLVSVANTFSQYNLSPVIASMVYLSFFLLALLHQIIHLEVVLDSFLLSLPTSLHRFLNRREYTIAIVCFFSLLVSLSCVCQGGFHLYTLVNNYLDRYLCVLILITTVPFIIAYIKQESLHFPIERACMTMWFGIAPLSAACLLTYFMIRYVYATPVVGYEERWANGIGWAIAAGPIVLGIGLGTFFVLHNQKGTLKERFLQSLRIETTVLETNQSEFDSVETGDTPLNRSPPTEMKKRPLDFDIETVDDICADEEINTVKIVEVTLQSKDKSKAADV